jgi:lipopolysaccharide export system protein LptA
MEGDLKGGVITFMDRVKVVRGDTILYADRVETYPKQGGEDVDRIVAIGNVRVVRGSRLSMADRAEYLEAGELLILSGHAKISEGNNTISGAVIRVYLDEDRTEVEGDTVERPRFLFYPEDGKGDQSVNPSE